MNRREDKAHIDRTIPIYQIIAMVVTLMGVTATVIIYQSTIDSEQNVRISENTQNIQANKESGEKFENYVMNSLAEINKRGERQEKKADDFYQLLVDIYRDIKDENKDRR